MSEKEGSKGLRKEREGRSHPGNNAGKKTGGIYQGKMGGMGVGDERAESG